MINNQTSIFTSFDDEGFLVLTPRSDGPHSMSSLGMFRINEYGELEKESSNSDGWEVIGKTPDLS